MSPFERCSVPPKRIRTRKKGACVHCARTRTVYDRGLCWTCCGTPEVKRLYPISRPKWDKRSIRKITSLFLSGMTDRQIVERYRKYGGRRYESRYDSDTNGKKCRVTLYSVRHLLFRCGIRKKKSPPWTRREEEDVLRWHLLGEKAIVSARRLGRTESGVHQKIAALKRKRGLQSTVPRQHRVGELAAKIRKLCLPGVPDSAVAAVLGIHRNGVSRARRRLGIPPGVPQGWRGIHWPKPPVPSPGGKLSVQELKVAIILYVARNHGIGASNSELSRLTGHMRQNIHEHKIRLGIQNREVERVA